MIRLPRISLDDDTTTALDGYQAIISRERSYARQVVKGKELWKQHSRNLTFNEVKTALMKMCCGARRCAYCEDSFADEIDHIKPKDIFPEHIFSWHNYVYACGPCNGPKNNNFAVFSTSRGPPISIARGPGDPIRRPVNGPVALINPRIENPLALLWLDLDTFAFDPNSNEGTRGWHRARYTIEVLGLNRRPDLIAARRSAYASFRARIKEYRQEKEASALAARLRSLRNGIRGMHHQTVFAEMQRQRLLRPELSDLFIGAAEACYWKPLFRETEP